MKQQLGAISQWTLGIFLSVVLLFPATLQLEHLFEGHDHKPCKETNQHLHEKQVHCHIYDFHFSTFQIETVTSFERIQISQIEKPQFSYLEVSFLKNNLTTLVRGPPHFS